LPAIAARQGGGLVKPPASGRCDAAWSRRCVVETLRMLNASMICEMPRNNAKNPPRTRSRVRLLEACRA
jgi:hypothetical protein